MKIANRSGHTGKIAPASTPLVLPLVPDSVERPLPSSTSSSHSPAAQYALELIKAHKRGYRPDKQWIKLRLGPGDYSWLEDQIKADADLWGYVEDKLRSDSAPLPIP
jgi:hypothetical protein